MSIDEARQVLADLEGKLAAASAREIELATEGRRLAYAAETGNEAAKKAVAKFDQEAFALDRSKKSLGHAILEGRRLLAEEERADERERMCENAEKAKVVMDRFVERQRKIGNAYAVISEESNGSMSDITEVNQLGFGNPRAEQYRVLGSEASAAALMFTPFKDRHVAPKDRRTHLELGEGWRAQVVNQADANINKGLVKAEEVA